MSDKLHISVSQLGTVKRCPRQWRYRYVENKICPPGIALITGSSFDEAYNLNYKQKIESKIDLPVEQVHQKFSEEFDKKIQEVQDVKEKQEGGAIKDLMVSGISTFHQEVATLVEPIDVQTELRISLDDQFDFLGFVDVLTEKSIIDNKTASRYEEGKYLTQLQAYTYMWHQLTGEVKQAELNYLIKTKKPSTKIEVVNNIQPEDFLKEEQSTINFIKKLHADPELAFKNPDGWHCSPKWCGYYHLCKGV